ncbi:hypothetical protein [Metabacillus sp. B2-18]|uniref:hypothetical protein n=1 Tax=Metabacillus sp. B2-18 TaxID=2897333 RepID=UPI001E3E129F|nr:hypothetical protein [Metabacillus sp. B2-18]UGB28734.1 hypothetical protein LPC09_13080 [Metabacillus sp. B2-18]
MMQIQPQTSKKIEIVIKKKFSTRRVLNIYGLFTVIALILSIFTIPISINEKLQLYYNKELILETYKVKEFLQFIFASALFFFFLVNIYAKGKMWSKVFYVTLILLFVYSLGMAIDLILNPISH